MVRWFVVVGLALTASCGRIQFDAISDGRADGPSDGGVDAPSDVAASPLAYVKASNASAGDDFGISVALSADGATLAVGAYSEDSAAAGVDGNQADNSAASSGAVYVFTRTGGTWIQQAYVKASNTGPSDAFGRSVALSADGSTLAVGAPNEDSAATGIDGNQADNSAGSSGAAYVFSRAGTTWTQQAYVKASNTGATDNFGVTVALSADGSTLAVGAIYEASASAGINGNQADNSLSFAGAAYVFSRAGTTWTQQAYVKASNPGGSDYFGIGIALSADGSTLAAAAYHESSAATGINGNQADDSANVSGAVYVYTRGGTTWTQQAYVKAFNTDAGDQFGSSVALSADGSTLAVGAFGEDSAATGVGGNSGNAAFDSGAAYVFTRTGTTWTQQAYVKASNTEGVDFFGESIALSADGSALAVGATLEDSATTGIDGDPADNSAASAGAVYRFTRTGTWAHQAYVKATNTDAGDRFGGAVALSGDGSTLVVGASFEASAAAGIDGNQTDDSALRAGAVYVFQ